MPCTSTPKGGPLGKRSVARDGDPKGGEQRHQERLGDEVPRGEPGGEGDEVHDHREAEHNEQHARVPWAHATGSVTGLGAAAAGAGCQPGPRRTRPTRSRQPAAALRSLAMAAYSWVATRSGL